MDDIIKYKSCGQLGDFIFQLSIVYENYLSSGKKGDLYITEKYKNWKSWNYGVETAYNDLKEIISFQEYISSFQIYNDETIDINLSKWRDFSDLYWFNIYEIQKRTFNVEWGKHKWLFLPTRDEFKDIILISSSKIRPNPYFDYNILKNYNKKIFFTTTDPEEFRLFKKWHSNSIELLLFKNLKDFWIAINSCYLFVTTFGSFLAAAHAMHKNQIVLLPNNHEDVFLVKNFPNIKWFKNEKKHNLDFYR